MNQGQLCMATERIIVDGGVADEFARRLTVKASSMLAGDPRVDDWSLGPMVGTEAVDRIAELIRDAVFKGAQLLCGGRADGVMMDATVLDYVTPVMRIYTEESFGPLVAIVRVRGIEDAVRVANDTEYGLSSAIFGRDVGRALAIAQRLETGICHVNGATVNDEAHIPFGGLKSSGYGRLGGTDSIREFTDLRWITVTGDGRSYPI